MNAVDTNIFVYALNADEPIKQAQALDAAGYACKVLIIAAALSSSSSLRRTASN